MNIKKKTLVWLVLFSATAIAILLYLCPIVPIGQEIRGYFTGDVVVYSCQLNGYSIVLTRKTKIVDNDHYVFSIRYQDRNVIGPNYLGPDRGPTRFSSLPLPAGASIIAVIDESDPNVVILVLDTVSGQYWPNANASVEEMNMIRSTFASELTLLTGQDYEVGRE